MAPLNNSRCFIKYAIPPILSLPDITTCGSVSSQRGAIDYILYIYIYLGHTIIIIGTMYVFFDNKFIILGTNKTLPEAILNRFLCFQGQGDIKQGTSSDLLTQPTEVPFC